MFHLDTFLRSRTSNDHEATAMIKTQFMSFWDGLLTDPRCQVMIVGATNRPHDVDAAILRRMPSMFLIGLPVSSQLYLHLWCRMQFMCSKTMRFCIKCILNSLKELYRPISKFSVSPYV